MDARGIDNDPGWINRKFQELNRKIEALGSERRAAATSVETGNIVLANGGSLVVDGGDVLMLDDDGSVLFRLGAQEYGDRGVTIAREDGSLALEIAKADPTLPPTLRIHDASGNQIVSEWPFGAGLARPLLTMPAYPVTAPTAYGEHGPEVTTTSTSWTTLWSMRTTQQNPLWSPRLMLKCSDGTTSAEVRVTKANGTTVLNDFFTGPSWVGPVPVGTTSWLLRNPHLGIDGSYGLDVTRHVQVRVTAGAGTVSLAIPTATGG